MSHDSGASTADGTSPFPVLQSPAAARRLRVGFTASGYTASGLESAFATNRPVSGLNRSLPRILELTRPATALNVLVRWFLGGVEVPDETARACLGAEFIEACIETGLLSESPSTLRPRVLIAAVGSNLIAFDRYPDQSGDLAADYVLAIGPSSDFLNRGMIRVPVESTLDLGCGCGVQAITATGHSRKVTATDLNPRAAGFTRFNVLLNGLEQIECLVGDGFEPVAGRQFDRIVSNPPYVVTPSTGHLYKDSGQPVDHFCKALAERAPRHLAEGGILQMVCEWVQVRGEEWPMRLRQWFEHTGCDAWVLKHYTYDPPSYALQRLRELPMVSAENDAATYAAWMDYYREHRVERIHGGMILMRRRPGRNWLRIEETSPELAGTWGAALVRGLAARDLADALDSDDDLLAGRFRISPSARLDHESRWSDGLWRAGMGRVRLADGLRQSMEVDREAADFLARFDGTRTVGEMVEDLARNAPDPSGIRQVVLRMVRRMVEQGVLLPVEAKPEA